MPNAIITAIMFVGNLVMTALPMIEVVFGISGATYFVTGALAITAGVVGMSKLMEMSIPRPDSNYARQKTVRSTTAPVKRVYGESLISGPVAFMGVGGTGNQDLWHVIALTGDKSEAITDIYLDNVIIPNADINSGNAAGGIVNGTSTIFRPVDSTTLVTVYKYIGGQTAVSQPVASEFFKWTSDHKGQGLTYIATKFSFPDNERIAEVWNKYNPQDIKALVKGMAIYDPRKDSTSPEYDASLGVSTHRISDSTTWQWSDNPALCLANYVIDDQFGMGVPSSAIDWASVHSSADYSDALVSIPNSQTQKRFTCNGVLYGTDSHAQNINKILSSMNGSLVYSSGKYVMQAGQYIEPESDAILTDNDLNGPINITVANTRDDRFNTIKGTHFNPEDLHKKVAFPEVQLTDIATRDAGEVLYKEVELPMTNDVYMCQRLTYQMINRSNDQLLIEFPCNLKALRYTVGDRVKITLDKFAGSDQDSISFNQTPFVILGFNFSAEGAVTLTMLKDTQANYTDMPAGNYSQIASDGSITDGFSGVPAPTNLSSVVDGHFVRLTWDNPVPNTTFNDIIVYQSSTSNFSDSSIFIRTKNDAITFSLPSSALTKYYWVRASLYDNEVAATDIIIGQTYRIRDLGTTNWVTLGATAPVSNGDTFLATSSGTSSSGTGIATDESALSAVVGPETVTTTDQVADSIEWIDVDDAEGLRPDNNATVGATLSVNFKDDDDSTILTATDVKNSVLAQEILRVEVEAGDVLDLETGAEVDIQNLGDVAIYVSNQDALLQGNINTVSTALSNLENTVVDLTSGVSDIYLQATAPVAGVGGVPDPIPDFSRWYDTDDNNAPYYWTGSAWASLEDPRIGANASSIVNLTASLSSTNTNVAANTTLAQGKIQSYFQDAEPTGGTYVTGDLWFDTNDKNKAYRWSGSAWQSIRDTDIDAAVTAASTAQSTADGKIVTFYQDAEPAAGSSSLGDLWIDTNDDNKLYRYNQTGTNPDTFAWQETRDAGISSAISAASTAQSTADGKIVTFIQDDVPADVDSSSGDLWFDTNDKNKLYRYSGTAWDAVRDTDIAQAISDASDAQATADGKVQTFIQNDAPTASDSSLNALFTGDLWIDSNDSNKLYRYTGSVWDAVRDTGIAANAESISVLDSTVSDIDDTVTALSTSNTSLVATIDFITKVSDEDGDVLEDEGSTSQTPVVIDMQDLTDVASATGQADQTLQTRVTLTEDTVTIQSTELTLLNSILTDGSGNLTAGANAVSALQTDVTQINTLDGTSTSANASALIALKSTVEDPSTGLSAVGGVVSTLTANVGDGATLVSDAQTLYAITGVVATNNWSSTQEYAVGDGVVSGGLPYVCVLANTNNVPPNATYWSPVNTTAALITDNNVARIGYCVDANGDLTDHKNATLCVAAGNTWNGDAAIAEAVKALRVIQPDGTYATIEEATSVISDDVGDVTAQKFIKIDNNGRIAGYGLYSTASGGTPDSEFVVVADRFTVVDPTSTGDDPIQPFTVTSNKIFLSTDVQVDGDLLTTGTTISNLDLIVGSGASYFKVSSDGLQLGNETFDSAPFRVTPAGALTATSVDITGTIDASDGFTFDGLTVSGTLEAGNIDVSGVINAGSLITDSATIANDIRIGSGEAVFSADENGIYLGNETFADAEFRVSPAGALTASSATLTGNVTASSFTLAQGATLSDLDGAIANTQQLMAQVTGIIDANQHAIPSFWRITTDDALAPSNTEFNAVAGRLPKVNDLVITTDTTVTDPVTPDRTYGWTCTVAGVADPATEATWTAITNFMSGDLLVDGSVSADQINANSVASAIITAGSIVVENDLQDGATTISGSNILTGTIIADYIDVSGVIQAGALITDTATINNDIRIGSGQSVFSADSNGIYLGNETFADAEFRVNPEGVLTATGANITGAITATSLSLSEGITIGTTNLDTTVNTSLGLADSSNQDSTSTILGGNLTGQVNGTAVATVESGAAAGATASQVNAGLALLLNKDTFGNDNTGEASLVSVDKDGNPLLEDETTISNGFIQWNGSKITVEAVQYTSSSTVKFTVLTGLADKRGFIVFDTTKSNPFTVESVEMDVAFAFKEGAQWYYDNNVTATTFTPTNDMIALGYLETGTSDLILKGGLINPVTLTAAAFPSDVVKSGSIGGILITPTTIESNFVTGVSGFQLNSDGTLEAGNGTFRGAITATSLNVTDATVTGTISANNIKVDNITIDTNAFGNLIVATDGVDTLQIKAGAVTPTEMTVTNLAAINADLGTVTAGSLDAGIITGDVNESNVIQNATSLSFNGPSGEVTILEGSVAASTGDGHKIFSVCSGYVDSTSSKVYWIRMYLRDTPTSSYVLTSTTKVKATTDIATPFTIAGGTTAVKTGEVGVKITIRRYGSNGITPDGSTAVDYVRERTCFIEGVR